MIPSLIEVLESRLRSSYKFADNWIELETTYAEQIIAALKAGQGMREMLSDGWNACRAWDAATKEEDV